MLCAHIWKSPVNCALWCAHEKNVRLRAYRKVWCLHFPSHSRLLLLAECETQIGQLLKQNLIRTRLRSDFLVDGDNAELVVLSRLAPVSWMPVRDLRKREFEVVTHHCVTIYRPANCAGAISASSKSMKTRSTMLSSVTTWMRRMADDVLLRTVLLKLCSAIQGTFAVKDQSSYVSVAFHLLGYKELSALFPFVDLSIPSGLCDRGVPVCFRQHCVNKAGSHFFLFAVASHWRGYWNVQCDPSIGPMRPTTMGKLRLPLNLIILPSIPDWRKSSVALL